MENKLTTRLPDYTQAPERHRLHEYHHSSLCFRKSTSRQCFYRKKYPEILDKPFLRLYLCSVNQPQNVARHVPT